MFSQNHVKFVNRESGLCQMAHIRTQGWSGMKDQLWIPRATETGHVIITNDRNDRTREYTVEDLKSMGARVILTGPWFDHLGAWDRAKWLVARIDRICQIAEELAPGSVVLLKT